jgi:hypothetical protein
MTSSYSRYPVSIPGYEPAQGEDMEFHFHSVGPDFMSALGMAVLQGREFTDADNQDAAPVMMVNQTFADRFWPGENPLGKLVTRRGRDVQVVGLVRDALYRSLTDEDRPAFFVPFGQNPSPQVTLLVRTSPGGAADILPMLRDEVASIDARLPITTLQTMEDAIAFTLLPQRVASRLLSLAGGLGLLLATVGLYGVISFLVAQRTREVGVRMALGAEAPQVVRLIVGRGLALSAVGAVVGLGLAALVTTCSYDVLPLLCPACGADMRILAFLTDPSVVSAILLHLDLPHKPPPVSPARGPPRSDLLTGLLDQTPTFDPAEPGARPRLRVRPVPARRPRPLSLLCPARRRILLPAPSPPIQASRQRIPESREAFSRPRLCQRPRAFARSPRPLPPHLAHCHESPFGFLIRRRRGRSPWSSAAGPRASAAPGGRPREGPRRPSPRS